LFSRKALLSLLLYTRSFRAKQKKLCRSTAAGLAAKLDPGRDSLVNLTSHPAIFQNDPPNSCASHPVTATRRMKPFLLRAWSFRRATAAYQSTL